MASKTPKNTTQTTTNEPPAYLRPYLQHAAGQAQSMYGQGPMEYYPGETVTPFSQETEQALGMITNRAQAGSPITGAAQQYTQNMLANDPTSQFGQAQNPWSQSQFDYGANRYQAGPNNYGSVTNPYLDATFNKAADTVQNRLATQFAGSGRNIGASRAVNADELNNLATSIYGGAYENERNRGLSMDQQIQGINANAFEGAMGRDLSYRGLLTGIGSQGYENERGRMFDDLNAQRSRQLGVLGMAPGIAGMDYADADRLAQVGSMREDLTGRQMEDAAARWDFEQNAPGFALDQYLGRLGGLTGAAGNTSSTSTPIHRNRTAGALGGAASLGGMAAALGASTPVGWGAAALGGLLGAFG